MSFLNGLFGGGGVTPSTDIANNTNQLAPHAGGVLPPGTILMTDNTTGLSQAQQIQDMQRAYTVSQGISRQTTASGLGTVIDNNTLVLREIRDELRPLKEWLIATYPDIYEQYRAVETLRQIGREK